ncbi:progranulin [Lepeophtheirus salmonis]|uniref:progranulin n=1 Tax=Lepeophtheirus salmonis TaxID=72036 RepID=UPI001AE96270|nr:progranulin-like [Lepeophtheirus salmonis]
MLKNSLIIVIISCAYFAEGVRDCPGGTECPSGCCPFENAFCCPDNIYCSLSAKFCPKKDSTKVLVQSLPKSKDNCPGGTDCPSGCCPIENAFCCPDGIYCAKTEDKCPRRESAQRIVPSTKKGSDNCPGGTDCPSGCCPIADAFCCPDNIYCATSASKCPKRNLVKKITSLLKNTIKNCPNGTECPSGCCNILNAFCCPDNIYCATSPENCPNSSFVNKIKPYN